MRISTPEVSGVTMPRVMSTPVVQHRVHLHSNVSFETREMNRHG